jgi:hypothetical protein
MSKGKRTATSKVDRHPECSAIEAGLAAGAPLRKLEARYGITITALCRHRQRMRKEQPELFRALIAADWKVSPEELEALRTETADGWLRVLRTQIAKLIDAQDRNLEAGADTVAAILANQVAKHLEMIGRAVNELGGASVTNIQNNVVLSPAFWQVRSAILKALAPYPEARSAVLQALRAHVIGEEADAAGEAPVPALAHMRVNGEPRS